MKRLHGDRRFICVVFNTPIRDPQSFPFSAEFRFPFSVFHGKISERKIKSFPFADPSFGCRGVGLLSPLRPLKSRNHREERSTCASSDNKGSMKLRSKNNFNLFKVFETKPGLVGLYISAAYSATLSTISTGLNSIATIFFKSVFDSSEKAKAQTGFT